MPKDQPSRDRAEWDAAAKRIQKNATRETGGSNRRNDQSGSGDDKGSDGDRR